MSVAETLRKLGLSEAELLELLGLERKPYAWVGEDVQALHRWSFGAHGAQAAVPIELFGWAPVSGTPGVVLVTNIAVWSFPDGAGYHIIGDSFVLPTSWVGGSAVFDWLVAGDGAPAGNVLIGGGLYFFRSGQLLSKGPDVSWSATVAIPATAHQVVAFSTSAPLSNYQAGDSCYVTFARLATEAADTYTGALRLESTNVRLL